MPDLSLQANSKALGPSISKYDRPHSVCSLEFYRDESFETLTEVCSAVKVADKTFLTAGHCTPNLFKTPSRIFCRGDQETQVRNYEISNQLTLSELRTNRLMHRHDIALIQTENDVKVPPFGILSSKQQTLNILETTRRCAIIGHGGYRHALREAGISTAIGIDPSQIQFMDDLIIINGFVNRASGLVEHGDSGGSLACEDKNGKWFHLAQVSGRDYNGDSFFAPVYLFSDQLQDHHIFSLSRQATPYHEIKTEWWLQDLSEEIFDCRQRFEFFTRFDSDFFDQRPLGVDLLEDCQHSLLEELKIRIKQENQETSLRIAPYSLIELELKESSIELIMNRSPERILSLQNPFTTADHEYTRFIAKEIDGDYIIGDLTIFGVSEYFPCRENILCTGGTFKNVRASLSSIIYPRR